MREADARTRREGLARMHNLLGRVEQLSAKPDVSLKAADRALRDVRAALSAIPLLPTKADYDDVTGRLKAVQGILTPKVTELREADEWQKWANVTVQEQLCAKMEALSALEDPEVIAREVRELQQQWRQAADVPRDKADGLWRRFKAAHDVVWTRCESAFCRRGASARPEPAKKIALCEQAEALADSTDWLQTADAIKKLQAEWKAIGPVSRGREKAVWDRFRTACDRFFTRRHDDLAQRKTVWAENLAKKDALCARVEALAESTDAQRGEEHLLVGAASTPAHGLGEPVLGLVGDLHALAAGVLAEPGDARRDGGGPGLGRCVGREVRFGDRADDEDLVSVGAHVDGADVEPVGEPAGEPSLDLVERCVVVSMSSWVLHAMKITSLHDYCQCAVARRASGVRSCVRCATMEPSPDETVTGAAYGGSRLTGDLEAPGEYAFDGRGELATQPGAAPEQAPEDCRDPRARSRSRATG